MTVLNDDLPSGIDLKHDIGYGFYEHANKIDRLS